MWLFISATERDMYTGDSLGIYTVLTESMRKETVPLRKD